MGPKIPGAAPAGGCPVLAVRELFMEKGLVIPTMHTACPHLSSRPSESVGILQHIKPNSSLRQIYELPKYTFCFGVFCLFGSVCKHKYTNAFSAHANGYILSRAYDNFTGQKLEISEGEVSFRSRKINRVGD